MSCLVVSCQTVSKLKAGVECLRNSVTDDGAFGSVGWCLDRLDEQVLSIGRREARIPTIPTDSCSKVAINVQDPEDRLAFFFWVGTR